MTGKDVYPHRPDLYGKMFWVCLPHNAYVGCHPGTTNPLGTLATKETREARKRAHEAFDALWKSKGMTRLRAYGALAVHLGLPVSKTHIGSFDAETCEKVVSWVRGRSGT